MAEDEMLGVKVTRLDEDDFYDFGRFAADPNKGKYYFFRLSVSHDDTTISGREKFMPYLERARTTYNMLKTRNGFPALNGKASNSYFFGHNKKMVSEFKNFTQFFPDFKFTLWLTYMYRERLYMLQVKGRTILDEVIFESEDGIHI